MVLCGGGGVGPCGAPPGGKVVKKCKWPPAGCRRGGLQEKGMMLAQLGAHLRLRQELRLRREQSGPPKSAPIGSLCQLLRTPFNAALHLRCRVRCVLATPCSARSTGTSATRIMSHVYRFVGVPPSVSHCTAMTTCSTTFNMLHAMQRYAMLRDATHAIVMSCIVDKQRRHATLTRMHDGDIGYNPTPVIDR